MRGVAALLSLLALAACDGGGEAAREEQGQAIVARTSEADLPAWLAPTDGTDPARWLAAREAGHPLPSQDEAVRAMQATLAEARTGFVEDPRMIANRTAQLGQMLTEIGKPEPYRRLLAGLGRVAAERGRHKSLYGEMCQHYYNSRMQGIDHDAAIARLSAREGR